MIGTEFRAHRIAAGLSYRAAARRLGVSLRSIQRWEADQAAIPSEVADTIRALGAGEESLMDDTGTTPAYALGQAIAILQEISGEKRLPLTVSQALGGRALATMARIAHQPQNAERRARLEDELTDALARIQPDDLPTVLTAEAQGSAWLGYYQRRASAH